MGPMRKLSCAITIPNNAVNEFEREFSTTTGSILLPLPHGSHNAEVNNILPGVAIIIGPISEVL